ncbi:phosphoglycerate dehydrogenase [Sporomusa sp.]|uniref:phosphoglycerate dehydrogenase n=1 Tax=Sporomusa sp. TaxID=2078658 RepID=UPI002D8044D7|nr:phosphoglycerate dehydrogenase [Sporomusa sp.]
MLKTVLITSKEFGSQIDIQHRKSLEEYFAENGWQIVWNSTGAAMSAGDIIQLNARHLLDAILVYSSSDEINREVFKHCRNLKVVSRHGVGIENIDVTAAQQAGVPVKTTATMPGYETVADLTFALLLSLARKVPQIDSRLRRNGWYRPISSDVWGKTLGIFGLGRIGKAVAKRAQGFDMKILVTTRHPDEAFVAAQGITLCTREELLAKADFVSLHCALNAETKHMLGAPEFALMKPSAYLINTARAGLVNQGELLAALKSRKIAGAAFDVFEKEPAVNDPIIAEDLDNVVATAHVGSYTVDSLRRMDFLVAENIVEAV